MTLLPFLTERFSSGQILHSWAGNKYVFSHSQCWGSKILTLAVYMKARHFLL